MATIDDKQYISYLICPECGHEEITSQHFDNDKSWGLNEPYQEVDVYTCKKCGCSWAD